MASVSFLVFVSLVFTLNGLYDFVESLPLQVQGKRVIYTRYVRRRPVPYSNDYVDEVFEVFNTRRRPPPYAFLHDEDLTRFVRCDFDPSLPDCDDASIEKSTSTTFYPRTSTEKEAISFGGVSIQPSTTLSASTTTRSPFWWSPSYTTEKLTTTTTPQGDLFSSMPTIIESTLTTNENNEYDNYENENDYATESEETDETTDYKDLVKETDSNTEALTEETTVQPVAKKPFFNWF